MKKALITLGKRMLVDSTITNEILIEMRNAAYQEIQNEAQTYGVYTYAINTEGHSRQFKPQIDRAATMGSIAILYKLRAAIPDLWDTSQRINLKYSLLEGNIPDVKVEVVAFAKNEIEKLQLVVYFKTEPFVLLDSVSDKLLLAFPNKTRDSDAVQTYFDNTFFLNLNDDIYFFDYNEL